MIAQPPFNTETWRLGTCCQFFEDTNKHLNFIASTKSQAIKNPERCIEKAFYNTKKLIEIMAYFKKEPPSLRLFRIRSDIWPCYTVPQLQSYYKESESKLINLLHQSRELATENGIRLSMHPDQFCVLGSKKPDVVERSIAELEYHARIGAALVDNPTHFVINIHLQGMYGGTHSEGINRFATHFKHLSPFTQKALSVENEDYPSGYDIIHILKLCEKIPVRACVDIHHYEAYHLGKKVISYTDKVIQDAIKTWNTIRPLFHASQPIQNSKRLAPHSGLFWDPVRNQRCFDFLQGVDLDIEAKEKEKAVNSFYDWIIEP